MTAAQTLSKPNRLDSRRRRAHTEFSHRARHSLAGIRRAWAPPRPAPWAALTARSKTLSRGLAALAEHALPKYPFSDELNINDTVQRSSPHAFGVRTGTTSSHFSWKFLGGGIK